MARRISFTLLALALLLAPLGCRLFHRRHCDDPAPKNDRDRDLEPGVIPPKGSNIPSPGLPTGPGVNRNTYSRPLPRLEPPADPFGPRPEVPWSGSELPSELPRPTEQNGWTTYPPEQPPRRAYFHPDPPRPEVPFDPTPAKPTPFKPKPDERTEKSEKSEKPADPNQPKKKLVLIPEKMPETMPDTLDDALPKKDKDERKYTPKEENGRPVPDASVFLPPVAPGAPFDLPKRADEPEVKREAKSSPKAETPPVGVPAFQTVKGTLAACGRVPTADGVAWLAKAGYRSLVYAHDPKADVSGVKKLAEDGGLVFVGLPVSAETFTDAAKRFDAGLAEGKQVYVCDDNGVRVGTLWYTHFRAVGLVNADAAYVRAWGLGLGDPDTNAEQKPLWDAALGYLGKK